MGKAGPPSTLSAEIEDLKRAREVALQAARAAIRDTSRVNRLLTVLSDPAPIESLLDKILDTISEIFSADVVILVDAAGTGHFDPVAAIGLPEGLAFPNRAPDELLSLFPPGGNATVLTTEALRELAAFDDLARALTLEAMVWIPMKGSRERRGALALGRCAPSPFTRDEIGLLSTMAYRIAVTLEQIQHKSQLERIIQEAWKLGNHQGEPEIANVAVRAFRAVFGADAAAIFRCTGACEVLCTSGVAASALRPLIQRLCSDPAVLRGEPVSLNLDAATGPTGSPSFSAVLAAPIFDEGRLHSLICALRTLPIDFSADSRQMAALYSGQLATALQNAHLYRALRTELQERLMIEASLRKSEERFRALVRNISDVIAILDEAGTITYAGDAATSLWGCSPAALVGKHLRDRVHPEDVEPLTALLADTREKPLQNLHGVLRMRDGETDAWRFFDVILSNLLHDPAVNGIVSTFHDVTERKIYEKELSELAFRDPLTGLANRANFCDRLRFALTHAEESNASVIVVFFDLDNFKSVNDAFGHAAGDATLRIIANRVQSCLRSNDAAARFGGDEFTILIEHIQAIDDALPLLERLQALLQEPVPIHGTEICVGGSIGVAISVPNVDDVDTLLQKADAAMYRAKRSGKGRRVVFDPTHD